MEWAVAGTSLCWGWFRGRHQHFNRQISGPLRSSVRVPDILVNIPLLCCMNSVRLSLPQWVLFFAGRYAQGLAVMHYWLDCRSDCCFHFKRHFRQANVLVSCYLLCTVMRDEYPVWVVLHHPHRVFLDDSRAYSTAWHVYRRMPSCEKRNEMEGPMLLSSYLYRSCLIFWLVRGSCLFWESTGVALLSHSFWPCIGYNNFLAFLP